MDPSVRFDHDLPRPGQPLVVRALLIVAASHPGRTVHRLAADVRAEPGVDLAVVRHGYEWGRDGKGRCVRLELGDLEADAPRQVFLEFRVDAELVGTGRLALGHLRLSGEGYDGEGVSVRQKVEMPLALPGHAGARFDPLVLRESWRLASRMAQEI